MKWEVRGILQRPLSIIIEAPSAAVALTLARTVRFQAPEVLIDLVEDEGEVSIDPEYEIYVSRADRRADLEEEEDEEEEEEPLHPSSNLSVWGGHGT